MTNSERLLYSALNNYNTQLDIDDKVLKLTVFVNITKKNDGWVVKWKDILFNNHFCKDVVELKYLLEHNFNHSHYTIL